MRTLSKIVAFSLSHPTMYKLQQLIFGGRRMKKLIFRKYLPLAPRLRVLDVGCGPAPDRDLLGDVCWTGIDLEMRYVQYVTKRLRPGDRILHGDVDLLGHIHHGQFDLILISGVLHHLPNNSARSLLSNCYQQLSAHGLVVSIDPVRTSHASWLETLLIDSDRGKFVRDRDGYRSLIPSYYIRQESFIEEGLSWVPQATIVFCLHKGADS